MRSGVIVAGGRSTRFDRTDKVVASLDGTPLIRRVADRVAPVVDEVVVNCRREQRPAIDGAVDGIDERVRFAVDEEPDQGPMVGIRNGLREATGAYAFVVAADMPFVSPDLVEFLFEAANGHDAAVPRTDDGWYQTMHAVYHVEGMRRACDAAIDAGERKILAPLDRLGDVVDVSESSIERVASTDSFENLNTRAAFDAAADRL